VRLWNTATGECVRVFSGHKNGANSCAFSPDGRWLASVTANRVLRLWSTDSGECERALLSVAEGCATWQPNIDDESYVRGSAWRYLGWFWRDADGDPAVWPLEVAPVTVTRW
jgi:WD40 repeat protein